MMEDEEEFAGKVLDGDEDSEEDEEIPDGFHEVEPESDF
jgi:hypothetical protein